jgi:hypothetical protein
MLFNRSWYEDGPERSRLDDYVGQLSRLNDSQRLDLLTFLSAYDPSRFVSELVTVEDRNVRSILEHYIPPPKSYEQEIWAARRAARFASMPAADELVEDAGLDFELDRDVRKTA